MHVFVFLDLNYDILLIINRNSYKFVTFSTKGKIKNHFQKNLIEVFILNNKNNDPLFKNLHSILFLF